MSDTSFWLLKTEPNTYSFDDLERDGSTTWDGVANNTALIHLRAMKSGDLALIYHTGNERRAVGIAEIISAPYPDPKANNPKLVVVDLRPVERLKNPVTLAQIKSDPFFADFALVRQARLSVMPVSAEQWQRILTSANNPVS